MRKLTKRISIQKLNSILDLSYHTKRIDYIFVSKNKITVKKYGVLANVKDQKYPSDHFPVFIIAEMR